MTSAHKPSEHEHAGAHAQTNTHKQPNISWSVNFMSQCVCLQSSGLCRGGGGGSDNEMYKGTDPWNNRMGNEQTLHKAMKKCHVNNVGTDSAIETLSERCTESSAQCEIHKLWHVFWDQAVLQPCRLLFVLLLFPVSISTLLPIVKENTARIILIFRVSRPVSSFKCATCWKAFETNMSLCLCPADCGELCQGGFDLIAVCLFAGLLKKLHKGFYWNLVTGWGMFQRIIH